MQWHKQLKIMKINTSTLNWTCSQNSATKAEVPHLKISSQETSLKYLEDHPNHQENNKKLCGAKEYSYLCLRKLNGNWDKNMTRTYQWESLCQTNTWVSRNTQIQNFRTERDSITYPSRKVSHLRKVVWDYKRVQKREIIKFKRSISSTKTTSIRTS